MTKIRVLAVRQPWASLIVETDNILPEYGYKTIEIRSHNTSILERVAIYASNYKYSREDSVRLKMYYSFMADDKIISHELYNLICNLIDNGERGKIIGTVEINSTFQPQREKIHIYCPDHLAPIDYFESTKQWYWNLRKPVKFTEPIEYKPPKGAVVWSKTELPEGIL